MRKRILVADDEASVVKVLKDRFTHWGYEVETASDGEQTLKKVASFKPHLILLDVRMPKINGIEVAARTKKKYPHIGILVLTASQSEDTVKVCLKKGADGYMLKPFKTQSIKEKVEELLKSTKMDSTHD
jgi:two-component system OmpR family response regulator